MEDPIDHLSVDMSTNPDSEMKSVAESLPSQSRSQESTGSVVWISYRRGQRPRAETMRDKGKKKQLIVDFIRGAVPECKGGRYLIITSSKLNAIIHPNIQCGALIERDVLYYLWITPPYGLYRKYMRNLNKYDRYVGGTFFIVEGYGETKQKKHKKIIHTLQFITGNLPLAVFGYVDQTVREALDADKRFTLPDQFSLRRRSGSTYSRETKLSDLESGIYVVLLGGASPNGL